MTNRIGNQELGVAGEFRIMSELLLRGFNPAKSYVDNGVDLILEDGQKIQIKTTNQKILNGGNGTKSLSYRFNLAKGDKKLPIKYSDYVDVIICWGVADNLFWIIPSVELDYKITLSITSSAKYSLNKYAKFLDNWKILNLKR